MCSTSRPPFSELHLLHQLHGVPTVLGDHGGFEPPTIAVAVDPEADLGARSHPLFLHALIAHNGLHVFRRPVGVAEVVGEPKFDTRTGHHVVGLGRDTCFRLQGRLGSAGTIVVDIGRRQTLGRTSRFVASHRRIRAKSKRTKEESGQKSDNFDHDGLLCFIVMNRVSLVPRMLGKRRGFLLYQNTPVRAVCTQNTLCRDSLQLQI